MLWVSGRKARRIGDPPPSRTSRTEPSPHSLRSWGGDRISCQGQTFSEALITISPHTISSLRSNCQEGVAVRNLRLRGHLVSGSLEVIWNILGGGWWEADAETRYMCLLSISFHSYFCPPSDHLHSGKMHTSFSASKATPCTPSFMLPCLNQLFLFPFFSFP